MSYTVDVLRDGYSHMNKDMTAMIANCTCTLIKGKYNIVVDTMTPWDADIIRHELNSHQLTCNDINFVVSTHGHSDHVGCNFLFHVAKHIVGSSISFRDEYYLHPFETGEPYKIDEGLEVIPTPGHMLTDVSVVVHTKDKGVVVVAGDLFEKEEDLKDPTLWRDIAGSENPTLQEKNRNRVLLMADMIIPGHGPPFAVTKEMKEQAAAANLAVEGTQ